MSEPTGTTPPPPPNDPPASPPPPPPTEPPASGGGGASSSGSGDRAVMNVLSYLWILALIPLLTQKDDAEMQWHAKNGLMITAAEFVAYVVVFILSFITAFLGCFLNPVVFLGFVILRIIGIVKANKGERLVVPGVSQFADSF